MSSNMVREFQVSEVLSEGWEGFKANTGVLIAAFILTIVVTMVAVAPLTIATNLFEDHWTIVAILSLVRGVVQTLLSAFFHMGFITITLKIIRGQTAEINDLFSNFEKLATGFLLQLLLTVAITIGLLMLVVPGVILALMSCLSMWFVVDRNMSVVDSIKASFEATRGSLLNLFIFGVIAMALSIVGSIPCGLGLLVVVPVLSLAASHIYMALTAEA